MYFILSHFFLIRFEREFFEGGFTVLSTKALSTLLTLQGIELFGSWFTYPLIAVRLFKNKNQFLMSLQSVSGVDSYWRWANPIFESCSYAI